MLDIVVTTQPPSLTMHFEWNSSFETGLRSIDLQHQELVELYNAAAAAHASGGDAEAMERLLPSLSAYILFHFGTEETLLSNTAVSDDHARRHRAAHRAFSEQLELLKQQSATGDAKAIEQLLDYLQEWLRDHIMKTDRELARQVLGPPIGIGR